MGAIDKKSARQRLIRLDVGNTAAFPIERYDYISSMGYRVAKQFGRKYTISSTESKIKVTRIQ